MIVLIKKRLNNNFKCIKLKITNRTITQLGETSSLKGNGTYEKPYILELGEIPVELSIKNLRAHLHIRTSNFFKLKLVNSQNIVIEESYIHILDIRVCKNLKFKNNSIYKLEQYLCKDITYHHNDIAEQAHSKLMSNYYNKRNLTFSLLLLPIGVVFLVFSLPLSSGVSQSFWLDSFITFLSGAMIVISMSYLLVLHRVYDKPSSNDYKNFRVKKKWWF